MLTVLSAFSFTQLAVRGESPAEPLGSQRAMSFLLLMVERWSKPGFKEGQILHVFANQSPPVNHWIGIRLEEQGHKGHAVGAKVILRSGSQTRVGHVVVGDSYFSQHAPVVHFGLGQVTSVDQVEIRWPDGRSTVLKSPEIDRYHKVTCEGKP